MPIGGGRIKEPPMKAGIAGRIVVTIGATGVPGIAILIGGPALIGNLCIIAVLNASCCLAWFTAACCAAETAIAN